MRIGIVPALNRNKGGIYQYSLSVLHALDEWDTDDRFVIVNVDDAPPPAFASGGKWETKTLPRRAFSNRAIDGLRRIVGEGRHREAWRQFRQMVDGRRQAAARDARFRPDLNRLFRSWQLDLMLYTWPLPMSFEAGVPYVMAIHDIQHRLQPEFLEVSANGEFENREYCFRNGSRAATLLLADSDVGKEDILACYGPDGVTADRVKVLPFLPASYLDVRVCAEARERVRRAYRLPPRYLFYPAQFWPHKNHLRIVKALGNLKQERGLTIPIVFCGSHSGGTRERTFSEVMAWASENGIGEQIHYLGYVPDEDISGVYAEAAALVMPTFFGPTNIPVLEAWAYGCPVLTSDIRGIREQVGDAAVLVDPRSVQSLADGIHRLWADERMAAMLAERGRDRLRAYTPDDFRQRLINAVEEAKVRTQPSNFAPA